MRHIKRKLGMSCWIWAASLVMVSGVGMAQNPLRGTTGQPRLAHVPLQPRISGCSQCHQDRVRPVSREVMVHECLACHSAGLLQEVSNGLQQAAQRTRKRENTVGDEAPEAAAIPGKAVAVMQDEAPAETVFPEAQGQGPGMNVSMYYAQTRIGAAPNEMIKILAGEFIRGSDQRMSDEGPQHKVWLDDFYIDKYEVTNLQYKQFIDAAHRKSPDHFENRTFPEGKADHPVTFVTWHDAKAYCEAAGKRLPSDQEWEKAARGTDGRTYPWGDVFDINKVNSPVRWGTLKLQGDTTPVGAFDGGVSPYGVHDMSGNVWEWTDSWYLPYPGNTKITENYGEKYKTLKGGSWWDCSFYKCGISAPVYNRSFFLRTTKNKSFGFRCAKSVTPVSAIPAIRESL